MMFQSSTPACLKLTCLRYVTCEQVCGGTGTRGNTFQHLFHVFVCSVKKVNTSLNTDLKIEVKVLFKMASFFWCVPTLLLTLHPWL